MKNFKNNSLSRDEMRLISGGTKPFDDITVDGKGCPGKSCKPTTSVPNSGCCNNWYCKISECKPN